MKLFKVFTASATTDLSPVCVARTFKTVYVVPSRPAAALLSPGKKKEKKEGKSKEKVCVKQVCLIECVCVCNRCTYSC